MADTEFKWLRYTPVDETSASIKEEPSTSLNALISLPESPSLSPPTPLYRRRNSTTSLTYTKRVRPYPILRHGTPPHTDIMPNHPTSGNWSFSATRNGNSRSTGSTQRQSPDSDDTSYSLGQQYINDTFVGQLQDIRPTSSNSSLAGAIGEANISSHGRNSRSPPSRSDNPYNTNGWNAHSNVQMPLGIQNTSYPGVTGLGMAFQNLPSQDLPSHQYHDFGSSSVFGTDQYGLHSRQQPSISRSIYPTASHSSSTSEGKLEAEVNHLRRKVRDLEAECAKSRAALDMMRNSNTSTGYGGFPTPKPQLPSFPTSWKARTDARKRMFCSLNRAGNALCAWHDSRRERRAYPPRNAPAGYLNCGCTHEEALFEESLARHGVGSYHPGESVRMDPALRNPLLKLLQQRYGYQDGDFERDPITGDWIEGEGAAHWEQQVHSGSSSRRRADTERH